MIVLRAPYPTLQSLIRLPDPEFSDVRQASSTVERRMSMNGTVRTYVQRSDLIRLTYRFDLTREASLALRQYILAHYAHRHAMRNHLGEQWLVKLVNNPFELTAARRAKRSGGSENVTIELQLEGEQIA